MKRCPHCAEEIQDEALVCRHCGRAPITPEIQALARRWWTTRDSEQKRIWAGLSPIERPLLTEALKEVPTPAGVSGPMACMIVVGCCGLALVAFVFFALIGGSSSNRAKSASPSASVGDEVRLVVGSGSVVVCVDEAAYRELTELAVANDTLGMAEQALAGRSFLVESGTKAQVIETGFEKRRVRILEGRHLGRSGWVTASLVRQSRP